MGIRHPTTPVKEGPFAWSAVAQNAWRQLLRDRLEDIPLLVDHFRGKLNQRYGLAIEPVGGEVLDVLTISGSGS